MVFVLRQDIGLTVVCTASGHRSYAAPAVPDRHNTSNAELYARFGLDFDFDAADFAFDVADFDFGFDAADFAFDAAERAFGRGLDVVDRVFDFDVAPVFDLSCNAAAARYARPRGEIS